MPRPTSRPNANRHRTTTACGVVVPALALVLGLGTGCAHGGDRQVAGASTSAFSVRSGLGEVVPNEEALTELARAPVVCFGERHDDASDHALEVALAEALAARAPRFAIGLEMVEAPGQAALDAYVAGTLDEDALVRELAWAERWGFEFELYRDLFRFARAHAIRLLALNVRREVVRLVARVGVEAARVEFGAEVPELRFHPAYRELLSSALARHEGMRPEQIETFLEAQRVWDESMAEATAAVLATEDGPTQVLVVAGAYHCAFGLGIPSALEARAVRGTRVVLGPGHAFPDLDGRAPADFVLNPPTP